MDIPQENRSIGWHDQLIIDLGENEAMELKKVRVSGIPGTGFRIRSETVRGESYDATIWNHVSSGISKEIPLDGREFGGHEVRRVRFQATTGSAKYELYYSKFLNDKETKFVNGEPRDN